VVDEAIALAIQLQKQHHLAEATLIYAGVLDVAPQHPDALHYTGLLAHQRGRTDEAIDIIGQSLELSPNQADWHSNLGIVLQSDGRLEDAIAEYEHAIAIDPGHANAHSNLGVLLRAAGRPEEAESAYRTAIRLCPNHADAYTNLGILLNGLNRAKEASECFCRAITVRPSHPDARWLLALAHCMIGEVDEAVKVLKEWLAEDPGDPISSSPRWPAPVSPPTADWRPWTSAAGPGCAGHCCGRTRRDSAELTCLPGCSPLPGRRSLHRPAAVRVDRVSSRPARGLRRHGLGRHPGVLR
jgi:tetratricopeptide (TPR) repeat protein